MFRTEGLEYLGNPSTEFVFYNDGALRAKKASLAYGEGVRTFPKNLWWSCGALCDHPR